MKPIKSTNNNYQETKDSSLLYLTISVLALFIGCIVSLMLYSVTLIDLYTVSKFWIGFTTLGFLTPLKYYQKWFYFIKYEMIIFNVLGIVPFLMALFLALNYLINTETTTQIYKIEKLYKDGESHSQSLGLILEGNAYSGEMKIIGMDEINPNELNGKPFLKLTIAKGLFGYIVIKERSFVNQ